MNDNKLSTELVEFLGAKNVEKIKDAVTDIIIKQFKSDFELFDEYVVFPETIQDMLNDICKDVKEDLSKQLKEKIKGN